MKKTVCFTVVMILLLTCVFCACDSAMPDTDDFFGEWMSYIKDDVLLKEVVIGGSHDAGCYDMFWLGETQKYTVSEQLLSGARYFDLRVEKTDDSLVIFHSIIKGVEFEPILDSIKDFIETHSSEVLLLDFQHFNNDSQAEVYDLIAEKLDGYLLENNTQNSDLDFIDELTLGECRGKCIVFWGSDTPEDDSVLFRRNNDEGSLDNCALDSYYQGDYNKMGSKDYIEEGLPYYIALYKEKNCGLWVLQGQLTDGIFIRGPKWRENTHDAKMTEYIAALKDSADLDYINVIMRDFTDSAKMANVIRLNVYKENVVSENEILFNEKTAP